MRVAIVHYAVKPGAPPDEMDTLQQVTAVAGALLELGHDPVPLPCTLNLDALLRRLRELRPDAVFNLMEAMEGSGRLIHLVPSLYEHLGLPYTGASTESLFLTSNKIVAKRLLHGAGLPTSPWIGPCPAETTGRRDRGQGDGTGRSFIVKSMWEHASYNLDDDEILPGDDPERIWKVLEERAPRLGGTCFAEAYVEGREFNLAIIDKPGGPDFLPPAEIVFEDYPEGKLKIVGYRAKWTEDSFEYNHTPRRFDFPPGDAPLVARLRETALRCWDLFAVRGYARVDFRVDAEGTPWILEVNANPCINPDGGFVAAAREAGFGYTDIVRRLLDVACSHPATLKAKAPVRPRRPARAPKRKADCRDPQSPDLQRGDPL
jgi:D-alanine-D-alanine ligase